MTHYPFPAISPVNLRITFRTHQFHIGKKGIEPLSIEWSHRETILERIVSRIHSCILAPSIALPLSYFP